MDLVGVPFLILALVGAFLLRIYLMRWQSRRTAKQLIARFGKAGAIVPQRARSLQEMDLSLSTRQIGLRDYRPAVLREMIQNGILLSTEDGRYYLSAEAYEFYNNHRRS